MKHKIRAIFGIVFALLAIGFGIYLDIFVFKINISSFSCFFVLASSIIIFILSILIVIRSIANITNKDFHKKKYLFFLDQFAYVISVTLFSTLLFMFFDNSFGNLKSIDGFLMLLSPISLFISVVFINDHKKIFRYSIRNAFFAIMISSSCFGLSKTVAMAGTIGLIKYFTSVTNVLICLNAFINFFVYLYLFSKRKNDKNKFFYGFDIITATCSLVTFLTVISYLQWNGLGWDIFNLTLHYISPLLFISTFIFLMNDSSRSGLFTLIGTIGVLIYGTYSLILVNTHVWEDFYGFLDFSKFPVWSDVIIILAFVLGSYFISFLLWFFNRISYFIFRGYVEPTEITKEEQHLEDIVKVTNEDVKEVIAEDNTVAAIANRVYHITRQKETGAWQVKMANSKRAIKYFTTQAEAIYFAKRLAQSQGGSIRVHSVKGKMRKA